MSRQAGVPLSSMQVCHPLQHQPLPHSLGDAPQKTSIDIAVRVERLVISFCRRYCLAGRIRDAVTAVTSMATRTRSRTMLIMNLSGILEYFLRQPDRRPCVILMWRARQRPSSAYYAAPRGVASVRLRMIRDIKPFKATNCIFGSS